jgi:predicted histidine transporter YuiF (NhaC family)
MIFDLPALLGFAPLLLYIILSFKGKDITMVVLIGVVIGAVMTGKTPIEFGTAIGSALGSFMGLIGFIILMGAGLGEVLTRTGVAHSIVNFVIYKTGVKSQKHAMAATMASSVILVSLLGSMAGANAILAPIVIPIVASFGITPSTLGVLLHGAGATGLILGPFVPSVVTTQQLTGISYGSYLMNVGLPIAAIIWVCTFFSAIRTQRATMGKSAYDQGETAEQKGFEPTKESKRATAVFLLSMLALVVYGILAKGGAAYVLTVMLVVAFLTGAAGNISADETLKALVKGSTKMYWLFFMFILYDPFLNFVTESGAFTAIADLISPLVEIGGAGAFMMLSTLVGIFGVSGAAVAQEKVLFDMFTPIATQLALPVELWSLVLLSGSQITFFAYPTGDMVGQMGLARSTDLKSMIKNGVLVTAFSIAYVAIRALIYSM